MTIERPIPGGIDEVVASADDESIAELEDEIQERYGLTFEEFAELNELIAEYQSDVEQLREEYYEHMAEHGWDEVLGLERTEDGIRAVGAPGEEPTGTIAPPADLDTIEETIELIEDLHELYQRDAIPQSTFEEKRDELLDRF